MIEEADFEAVVREHLREWQSAAWRVTDSCSDAEDAVQDALAAAWTCRRSFEGRAKFSSFVYGTVIHKAYDLVRRAAARRQRESQWQPEPPPRRNGFLYEAISLLPELYRATVIAMLESEMHHGAAASRLGCSENAVCKRMLKAKKMLSGLLEQLDEPEKIAKNFISAGRKPSSDTTKE